MKKLLKHLLAFTFVISVLFAGKAITANAAVQETAYQGSYYAKVTAANGAYVYSAPDTSSAKNDGGVSYGWTVQCLSYTDNGFTKIKYYYGKTTNTFTGYVLSSKLTVTQSEDSNTVTTKTEKFTKIYGYTGVVTTNGGSLNVRSAAKADGNNSYVITALHNGTTVAVLAKSATWYKIQFNHNGTATTGFVYRKYMKVVDALKQCQVYYPSAELDASQKYQLSVYDPATPYALSKKISWKSSKKSVATVSSKGVVTAKNAGTATITCTIKCGNRKRTIKTKIRVTSDYALEQ